MRPRVMRHVPVSRWSVAGPGVLVLLGLAVALSHGSPGAVGFVLLGLGTVTGCAAIAARPAWRRSVTADTSIPPGSVRTVALAGGVVMILGLLVALVDRALTAAALQAIVAAVASAGLLFVPAIGRALRRAAPVLLVVVPLVAAIVVLVRLRVGSQLGFGGLWLPIVVFALGASGVALLAGTLGAPPAGAPAPANGWGQITGRVLRRPAATWRVILGALLVLWAIGAAIALVESHVARHPALVTLSAVAVVLVAVLVVATPLAIAGAVSRRRQAAERTREAERQRIAAHLHDSVLQTLALVQRQAGDADAVRRLARRQEVALRAWMSGEGELTAGTLSAALQTVIDETEDALGVTVDLSMVGDRAIGPRDTALIGAVGESLRNAAAHARGSPATVYAEVGDEVTEVYVSDEGPGFSLDAVPDDRRGIRDSILARMSRVGGSAEITSQPGQGTEVLLRLPAT